MAKTRNSKIKESSQEIIEHLKSGLGIKEITKLGYSRDTVRYYRRKLFDPEKYELTLKRVAEYNKKSSK